MGVQVMRGRKTPFCVYVPPKDAPIPHLPAQYETPPWKGVTPSRGMESRYSFTTTLENSTKVGKCPEP